MVLERTEDGVRSILYLPHQRPGSDARDIVPKRRAKVSRPQRVLETEPVLRIDSRDDGVASLARAPHSENPWPAELCVRDHCSVAVLLETALFVQYWACSLSRR
jgi:hypothetical protein